MPVAPLHIPIPDADEVIPIHTSDRSAFKFCRRRWDWSSPMRRNLVPKSIQFPLWFGTGFHYALEQHYADMYEPGDQITPPVFVNMRDFFEFWWYNEMRQPDMVSWLEDADAEDHEELQAHHELGVGMCDNYQAFAAIHDNNFEVVATEHDFSIPLGFEAYDVRTESMLPVHYRGRLDMIIRLADGRYGIMDHKTAARVDDDYFAKLDMDEQCTSYLWAAQEEATLYDLPWKKLEFVVYNVAKKAVPAPPETTYKGKALSLAKDQATTSTMFMDAVNEHGLQAWFQGSEKAQAYHQWLGDQGWSLFFRRHPVRRNRHELHNISEQIKLEAWDMLSDPRIYPNPSGTYQCLRCPFRSPCLAKNDGSDAEFMLEGNFRPNKDRGIQAAVDV